VQTVMVQFKHDGPPPTVDEVRRLFNLSDGEVDDQFGVIAIDPDEHIYAALVSADASERVESALASRSRDPAEGIFSNPKIEPFGPPAPSTPE